MRIRHGLLCVTSKTPKYLLQAHSWTSPFKWCHARTFDSCWILPLTLCQRGGSFIVFYYRVEINVRLKSKMIISGQMITITFGNAENPFLFHYDHPDAWRPASYQHKTSTQHSKVGIYVNFEAVVLLRCINQCRNASHAIARDIYSRSKCHAICAKHDTPATYQPCTQIIGKPPERSNNT